MWWNTGEGCSEEVAQRTFKPAELSVVEVGAIIQTQLYWGQGWVETGEGEEGISSPSPRFSCQSRLQSKTPLKKTKEKKIQTNQPNIVNGFARDFHVYKFFKMKEQVASNSTT